MAFTETHFYRTNFALKGVVHWAHHAVNSLILPEYSAGINDKVMDLKLEDAWLLEIYWKYVGSRRI